MTHSESAPADWIGAAIGVALAGAEVATHHNIFTLSNLVACTVASDILQLVGIRSFRTATVLLLGAPPLTRLQRAHSACTCTCAPVCRTR